MTTNQPISSATVMPLWIATLRLAAQALLAMTRVLTFTGLALIKAYRLGISGFLGHCCRFEPSCSHYAEVALKRHGFGKGCYLAARRLLRCHPWHAGGFDPVPDTRTKACWKL